MSSTNIYEDPREADGEAPMPAKWAKALANYLATSARRQVLEEAADLTDGPRAQHYGPPAVNMDRTARMWSAYLGIDITGRDVAWCMALLKIAREAEGHTRDSSVDAAAYAAIAHEVA